MSRCDPCGTTIEGEWTRCPLCAERLEGDPVPGPLPAVPLTFSRRRVVRALVLASLGLVVLSFVAQLLYSRVEDGDLGVFRWIWIGVCAMWLVVLMAVGQRRNVGRGTTSLVIVLGLLATYVDYLTGWHGWALDYVVPILCSSAIIALLITVRVMRTEVGDHILYSGLTLLMGMAPLLFLVLGWIGSPIPSMVGGLLCLYGLMLLLFGSGPEVRHELAKRLHL